jgi:hypothetical protein
MKLLNGKTQVTSIVVNIFFVNIGSIDVSLYNQMIYLTDWFYVGIHLYDVSIHSYYELRLLNYVCIHVCEMNPYDEIATRNTKFFFMILYTEITDPYICIETI